MGWRRVVAATVVVAVVTGCGQTTPPVVVADGAALSAAVAATEQAGTAKIAMDMRFSVPGMADPVRVVMQGAGDLSGERANMRYVVSGGMLGFDMGDGEGQLLVLDPRTAYVNGPLALQSTFGQPLPDGIEWVALEPAQVANVGLSVPSASSSDPGQYLAWLEEVSGTIEQLGREDQRGVATTHVRGQVAFVDLLGEEARQFDRLLGEQSDLPDALRDQFERMIAAMRRLQMTFDVWVDDERRVRRVLSSMDMGDVYAAVGMAGDSTLTIDLELFDFGVEFSVEEPDPATVMDQIELHRSLRSEVSAVPLRPEVSEPEPLPEDLASVLTVPDDARLLASQVTEGLIAATWTVLRPDTSVADTADVVAAALRDRNWEVRRGEDRVDGDAEETSLQLEGHGYDGLLVLTRSASELPVTLQLTLVAR